MDLKDLYREVILDHNRSPRHFGRLEPHDASATGHNPLCGDRLSLTLRLAGEQLTDVAFEGQGCAISVASASMMSEAVKGLNRAQVEALFQEMHAVLTSPTHVPRADLGKLLALGGVREFPARVKCASLCWHTLQAALQQHDARGAAASSPVSTE
jgi:nitrogen fixation NifU-like protein